MAQIVSLRLQLSMHAQQWGIMLKVATIIFATLVLFRGDLLMIFSDALGEESMGYVLSIPAIIAYLVYRKRKAIEAIAHVRGGPKIFGLISADAIAGGLLLLISLGIFLHASYTMMSLEYRVLALIIFVASCILILFSWPMLRQLIFPLLLLALLFPPAEILYNAGSALSIASSTITYVVLKASGYPVSLNTAYENPWLQIVTQNGTPISFLVDPACSGIYSLMGFLVFALFIAYLVRGGLWKRATAFFIGFPVIYSLNITRLIIIVLVGYYYGETIALNLFHVFGGWILVFVGTLLLLASFRKVFSIDIGHRPPAKCETCEKPASSMKSDFCFSCSRLLTSSAAKLKKEDLTRILVIVISVVFITALQTPIILAKGPIELVVNTAQGQEFSTDILPQVDGYSLAYAYRDREFETIAKQDLSLIYSYLPKNGTEDTVWVLLEIASIELPVRHRTEACLIKYYAAGERVQELVLSDHQILENPPIVSRFCVFNFTQSRTIESVVYWFQTSVFSINSTIVQKYVKISLVVYPTSLDNIYESEDTLLTFAKSVVNYWQPTHIWSELALELSRNRYVLLLSPPCLLAGMFLYVLFQKRRETEADAQAYYKLSDHHKQVVNATSQTQKSKSPTFVNILSTYRRLTGKSIEKEEFYINLLAVEKTGVIKGGIASVDDHPFKVWKTRVDFK